MDIDRATHEVGHEFKHLIEHNVNETAAAILILATQFRRLEILARDFIDMMEKEKRS